MDLTPPKSNQKTKKMKTISFAVCGEAGELADKVKKVLRDREGKYFADDVNALSLELGDILWYVANLAKVLGYNLSDIAQMNLDKIASRIERGTLHGKGDNR